MERLLLVSDTSSINVHSQVQEAVLFKKFGQGLLHGIWNNFVATKFITKSQVPLVRMAKKRLHTSQVAYQVGAYPRLCNMKRQGVFLLPPGWMLVNCRITPSIKFASTQLYTWWERDTARVSWVSRVSCPRAQHPPVSLARAWTQTTWSRDEHNMQVATTSRMPLLRWNLHMIPVAYQLEPILVSAAWTKWGYLHSSPGCDASPSQGYPAAFNLSVTI